MSARAFVLTLHLDEELGLDPARRLALVLAPGAAQGVDLVYEDDGGFVLSSQTEQVLHQPGEGETTHVSHQGRISPVAAGHGFTSHFSLSPNHLDTRSEDEMEKKVELLASVATALAR